MSTRTSRLRRHGIEIAAFVATALLGLAWAMTNPPGAAPDEPSHYVRVVGLSYGQVFGESVPSEYFAAEGYHPGVQIEHLRQGAGLYRIPASSPPPVFCNRFRPRRPWTCRTPMKPWDGRYVSLHATTPPASYVVPAIASRLAHTTNRKLLLARLAYTLQGAVLVSLIVAALRRLGVGGKPKAVALLSLTFTPLLAFEVGTIAPNGTETLAIVAFAAWLLVALRRTTPRSVLAAGVLGAVACLMRDIAFIGVCVSAAAVVASTPHVRRTWTTMPWRMRRLAAAVTAGGVVWGLGWYRVTAGVLGPLHLTAQHLRQEVERLWPLLLHSVSLVGSLDVRLDEWTALLWWAVWAVLVIEVVRRNRRAMAVVLSGAVVWCVLNVALSITSQSFGFGGQARYTLYVPAVLAICVLANNDSTRITSTRSVWMGRAVLATTAIAVGAMHFAILLVNAQRHANGLTNRPMQFSHTVWTPRGGWTIVLVVCGLAAVAWTTFLLSAGWGRSTEGVGE